MAVKRIAPEEARDLMDKEGYVYLDVRTVEEFAAGHPTGAYNVPLLHMGPGGMTPNPEFLAVVEKAFPRDARVVVGCKAGGRSAKAAAALEVQPYARYGYRVLLECAWSALEHAGYTNVVDQRNGFEGTPLPTGGIEPGWRPRGLPTSTKAAADHTYDGLLKARGR